jgi:hypothetical protein
MIPVDILFRFWSFVDRKSEDECWLWRKQGNRPYGNFSIGHRNFSAHRFSYYIHNGVFDENLLVRHTCDNSRCVNPKHLILGTQLQNRQDAVERGRTAKGQRHGMGLLNDLEVVQIKRLLEETDLTLREIGETFDVSASCIGHIKYGNTHADEPRRDN